MHRYTTSARTRRIKDDLRTLLLFLEKEQYRDLREYLKCDFISKISELPPHNNVADYLTSYIATVDKDSANLFPGHQKDMQTTLIEADVVIMAVFLKELQGLKMAFRIPQDAPENYSVNGMRFWECTLPVTWNRDPLKVVLTMIGQARTLEAAAATSTILHSHSVGLAMLVGIAAGLESKTKIGDVVAAYDMILDYEGQRLEPDGPKKRPKPYPLNGNIKRDLEFYEPTAKNWLSEWKELLTGVDAHLLSNESATWNPAYHLGIILSGEKLLADGSLPQLQADYSEKVRAAEMEGSGFARLCDEENVPWLVFRGVSDYGTPQKHNDPQVAASVLAALCARSFLVSEYRPRDSTLRF